MISKSINDILNKIKTLNPLVHCITNPISINQCANSILCVGAKPIMAEHPDEVEEITNTAKSLMLNLGNITDTRMKSMEISLQTANEKNIPSVIDLVGIACSDLRRDFAYGLLKKYFVTVIKGNYSEIYALINPDYKSLGVDSDKKLDCEKLTECAVKLAKEYNCIIFATGKTDIITDGRKIIYINNGTPQLASVTGTGCMLGALCASFLSVEISIYSVACACAVLGIAGELSATENKNGTFTVNLMDNLSSMSDYNIEEYLKAEEKEIENI